MGMTGAELDALNKADLRRRMGLPEEDAWDKQYGQYYKDKGMSFNDIQIQKDIQSKQEADRQQRERENQGNISLGDVGQYNAETGSLVIKGEDPNKPSYWYNAKTNTTTYNGQKIPGKVGLDAIEGMGPEMDAAIKSAYDEYIGQAEKTPEKYNFEVQDSEDWLGQGATSQNFGNWQKGNIDLTQGSLDATAMSKAMSNLNKNKDFQTKNTNFWKEFEGLQSDYQQEQQGPGWEQADWYNPEMSNQQAYSTFNAKKGNKDYTDYSTGTYSGK
jgi:hypothetical protein